MLVFIIWLIGYLFTSGLCTAHTETWDRVLWSFVILLLWPLLLGCWVKHYLKTKEVIDLLGDE